MNGEECDEIKINKGVLQGEITSPLLFILFIDDLLSYIHMQGVRRIDIDGTNEV